MSEKWIRGEKVRAPLSIKEWIRNHPVIFVAVVVGGMVVWVFGGDWFDWK